MIINIETLKKACENLKFAEAELYAGGFPNASKNINGLDLRSKFDKIESTEKQPKKEEKCKKHPTKKKQPKQKQNRSKS